MGFTNDGCKEVRNWMAGDSADYPSHIGVGTDSSAASSDDSSLGTETGSRKSVTATTPSDKEVKFSIIVTATEQDGNTLTEMGLFNASSSGDMFSRHTYAQIEKTDSNQVQMDLFLRVDN